MAILRRYAAIFRVGISFIFSRIKSRSASVTLNLICTVLLRPSMLSLLSVPRVWDTSQQAVLPTLPQGRTGKIRKWVPASYACYECFYPLGSYPLLRRKSDFAKLPQKKNAAISKKITTLSKPYSILTDTFHLPSVSTSAISFAVALTIRMPVSLIPSRSASSCRRCVFFSGGVSKRNWSTDIL